MLNWLSFFYIAHTRPEIKSQSYPNEEM